MFPQLPELLWRCMDCVMICYDCSIVCVGCREHSLGFLRALHKFWLQKHAVMFLHFMDGPALLAAVIYYEPVNKQTHPAKSSKKQAPRLTSASVSMSKRKKNKKEPRVFPVMVKWLLLSDALIYRIQFSSLRPNMRDQSSRLEQCLPIAKATSCQRMRFGRNERANADDEYHSPVTAWQVVKYWGNDH